LNAGEAALTFTPVYPPFLHPPVLSGHRLYRLPLTDSGRRAEVDFDALERAPPEVRLLMWCHPQNPTGRCFSRGELERVADWCLRRDAIVVSDEIHCGLVIEPGARHIPLASLSPEIAARTITLMAPSKTYNIPGLCCSFAIIPDRELRRRFLSSESGSPGNLFGYVACEAAYRHGESWRKALLSYVRANRDYLETEVARMPGLRMLHPEATYLAWIDTRVTGLEKPVEHWRKKAGLELADGAFFGAPGWLRLNYACPRRTLEDGVRRLRAGAELARASA
jgi:cystathionine beta-lyase